MNQYSNDYDHDDVSFITTENLDRIKRFRLMDDTFFAVCFDGNKSLAEFILRILLDKPDLHVIRSDAQYTIKNLVGHSVTMDAYACDDSGKKYNIEVQRTTLGAIPERARYYSSMIDFESLHKAQDYADMPDTYVIFITENDVLQGGLPIYHIERIIVETGTPFGDRAHVVYVNGAYADDSDLGRLIHDMKCANPDDMNYSELSQITRYFKENKKEVRKMCKIMEEMCQEVREEAEAKFAKERAEAEARISQAEARASEAEKRLKDREEAINNAIVMLRDGLKVEKIALYTKLPVEKVQQLANLIAG